MSITEELVRPPLGALTVPRFLEFELRTDPASNMTDYWTTKLNEDKDYITFRFYLFLLKVRFLFGSHMVSTTTT